MGTALPAAGIRGRSATPCASVRLDRPSPNFGPRRDGLRPCLVVLHYTGMQTADLALDRLCDPQAEVSAHWFVRETGECLSLVPEEMRAWHAGAGEWAGLGDVNSRSIGIELANTGAHPFPAPQMAALETLLAQVIARWNIPAQGVIAHSDMAPDRKSDPGPRFDWRRLALAGLSVWPEPLPAPGTPDIARFHRDACAFGYPRRATSEAILAALRLRFRPWASGPFDAMDAAIAEDLANRFAVDGARSGA